MIIKGHFEVKRNTKGKSIELEGLANALVKDRIGDIIPKDAWMLDNFKKNPIIFLNHDSDTPIGKAIGIEPTDKGLSIKVRLSRSNEGKIPMVRDLVNEGILKSFSVGFDDHGSAEKSAEGDNIIKKAELIETSIVSVPMNQDSLFSVVGADVEGKTFYSKKSMTSTFSNCDTYFEMKQAALNEKGAWVAAALHNTIYDSEDEAKQMDAIYEMMADDMVKSDVDNILAGNVLPVPDSFIKAAAEHLNLDVESLKALNRKADEEEEEEEEEDEEKSAEKDFQDCVNSKVPKLIEEGIERDEAIAQAISFCEDSEKCSATPEMIKAAVVAFNAKAADEEEDEDEEDEEEDEDKKKAADEEDDEDKEDDEDEDKKKALDGDDVPIPLGKESDTAEEFKQGQPDIELAKSQLALAGSMVSLQKETLDELRKLTDILSSKATEIEVEEEEEEADKEDGAEEEEKAMDEEEEDEEDEEDKEKMLRIQKDMDAIAKAQLKLNKLLMS